MKDYLEERKTLEKEWAEIPEEFMTESERSMSTPRRSEPSPPGMGVGLLSDVEEEEEGSEDTSEASVSPVVSDSDYEPSEDLSDSDDEMVFAPDVSGVQRLLPDPSKRTRAERRQVMARAIRAAWD